jgi:hypothetical protein
MQGLVEKASRVTCSLEITRSDIYNEVGRVKQKSKAMENSLPTVSPVMFEEASPPNNTDDPTDAANNTSDPSSPTPPHVTAAMAAPVIDDSFLEGKPITGTKSNEAV